MKLEEIEDEWSKDCKIDKSNLDNESLKIPELHNKYYKMYSRERAVLKKLENEYKHMIRVKKEYYSGELSQDELKQYGWPQFDLRVLKSDLNTYVDSDKDILELKMKLSLQSNKVDFLHSIIDTVIKRTFIIKHAIEFLKFTNGMA